MTVLSPEYVKRFKDKGLPVPVPGFPWEKVKKYSEDQERGPDGRWVAQGGGGVSGAVDHTPDRDTPEWHDVVDEIRSQGVGNCFEAAVTLAMNAEQLGLKNVRIVQGTVMGQGKLAGLRFVHAWVEADAQTISTPDGGEYTFRNAYDYASGNSTEMPDALYRHLGQVEDVDEWDWDSAVRTMLADGTYGPWNPDLKGHV